MLIILITLSASSCLSLFITTIIRQCKLHAPLTHAHRQPSLPPSPHPPPLSFLRGPRVNADLSFKSKITDMSFLKYQTSQEKSSYPNNPCTCQLNIIKIPYRNKAFSSEKKRRREETLFPPTYFQPSTLLNALVIQKFQSPGC